MKKEQELQHFQQKICSENSHTILGRTSKTFLGKHSITRVFRMILRNFLEQQTLTALACSLLSKRD